MARRAAKSPAYQWYPRDYMSDAVVVSMTLEQEGAYRRLLDVCWLERGLPTDLGELWRLAKASSRQRFERVIWPVVGQKFYKHRAVENTVEKFSYQNRRLDRERAKQAKTRKIRQLAARDRWISTDANADAHASRLQCLAFTSASASATAVDQEKSTGAARRPVENAAVENRGTFGLYCKIADEARQQSILIDHTATIANISAWFKTLCGQRQIDYDGQVAARAIAAVLHEEALA